MFRITRIVVLGTALTTCLLFATQGAVGSASHDPMGTTHASKKRIAVRVETKPAPRGVLVHAITTGYRFAPERLSPVHGKGNVVQGEGHGHVYVDGAKTPKTMIVGPWTYITLTPGRHTVRVTLNANDHNEWTWQGMVVEATTRVTVPKGSM